MIGNCVGVSSATSRLSYLRMEGDFDMLSLSLHLLAAKGRGSGERFGAVEDDGVIRWKKLSFLNIYMGQSLPTEHIRQ